MLNFDCVYDLLYLAIASFADVQALSLIIMIKVCHYFIWYIPVHDTPVKAIVLAGNNRIVLLKASSTRIPSNLEDACLFCS